MERAPLTSGLETRLADYCPYWYPPDIVDSWVHNLLPRHVRVMAPPISAGNVHGGIHIHVGTAQKAFIEGDVEDLVSAVQQAINKKESRGQMTDVSGQKWLAVALDGNNPDAQLENAFGPAATHPRPDLSSIHFTGFDQVWLIAKTFHGQRFRRITSLSHRGCTPVVHSQQTITIPVAHP